MDSLRERRKAQVRDVIGRVTLELAEQRGFANLTMGTVAAAADIGERTLYRYAADKEELLFLDDELFQDAFREALRQVPEEQSGFAALRQAAVSIAGQVQKRADELRRRAAVIASSPALLARDRAKHAAWEDVLAEALVSRGTAAPDARLTARLAVCAYSEAYTRWLADDRGDFAACMSDVFDDTRRLVARPG